MNTENNNSSTSSPKEEIVDLIDMENNVIGEAPRSEVRQKNLLHRGVGIICFNSKNEVYVHQRTDTKDVFPSLFDMFVGGVVGQGETYQSAAKREIAEELGIVGPEPKYLFRHYYFGELNNSLIQIYSAIWDGEITHQEEEVAWGAWLPLADLDDWTADHAIVPDGLEVYEQYKLFLNGNLEQTPAWA